jgi:hypothetical protein
MLSTIAFQEPLHGIIVEFWYNRTHLHPNIMKYTVSIGAILIVASCLNLFGQFQKSTVTAGGSVDLYLNPSDPFGIEGRLKPTFGFFPANNFLLGVQLDSYFSFWQEYTNVSVGLGPIIRYYYGKEKTSIFGHFSYSGSVSFSSHSDDTRYENIFLPGIGLNYMLSPNVGLETMLGLYLGDYNSIFSLSLGLQVFFPPRGGAASSE